MPFPFTLPTTSAFSFSSSFSSESHPSLPLTTSTHRGVLRDALKKHKRLSPPSQATNLAGIQQNLQGYIPYLLAIDGGLSNHSVAGEEIDCILTSTPELEWRPTISASIPGRETPRVKLESLEYEIYFVLSTLAYSYTNLSRAALYPLYASDTASPGLAARTTAITTATKHLLLAASIHSYLGTRSESLSQAAPCVDLNTSTFRALSSLAHAEATLLAVLKDDPYPAAVTQDRNSNDKEWMIKAPDIPKVRAHLFARLCLAAADHASKALSLLNASAGKSKVGKVDEGLLKYVEDLRKTGRGKACRFFAIDAELGGQTGTGIAWCRVGMEELGFSSLLAEKEAGKKSTFSRLKKDWNEKREDKKIEKGTSWGGDAGRLEESRVLSMLEAKWVKMNDTINTQIVPPSGPLLATIPTGRDIHSIKPFEPPSLDASVLEAMRAPPERSDDFKDAVDSSDDETAAEKGPAGAFPGTSAEYSGKGNYY